MKLSFSKKQKIFLIVLVGILITSNIIFGIMVFRNQRPGKGNFPGGMQMELSQDEINSITSFFNNNPSETEISDYCDSNRMYCAYYCMNIDSGNEVCSSMQPGGDRSFPS